MDIRKIDLRRHLQTTRIKTLETFKKTYERNACFPPGHYYSPIVDVNEIIENQDIIWGKEREPTIEGINLNVTGQLDLLRSLQVYYAELPFTTEEQKGMRYYYHNDWYSYSDAIILYLMMRHYKPNKIIEVGSGFSSAVMLDTNDTFFKSGMELTFIEPFPDRLNSLLRPPDRSAVRILNNRIQDISLEVFAGLDEGDILFIDSSHVSKTGSDVNYILFEVLPVLQSGVLIHFHDIFYPFEYHKAWVMKGHNWNEAYFLRSFLMYNDAFKVHLFTDYIHKHHSTAFKLMPLCYKNWGGNLWLQKV